MQVALTQVEKPAITNEDVRRSVPKYVHIASNLVAARVEEGRVEDLGGKDAVRWFFASVKVRS